MNKKYLATKILATLLPTLILWQNYGWMTMNKGLLYAFFVIWAFLIWRVLKLEDKNHILYKVFRFSEIGAFLLPISALILTFGFGAKAVSSTSDEFAQAGAAIGTAVGGFFVVFIAFIFGLFGGIILHLIANRYEKKMKPAEHKTV